MPREAEPSLNEKTFVTQALSEGLRLDSREFDQYRPLELTFGDDYGVAEVNLGKTRYAAPQPYVLCKVLWLLTDHAQGLSQDVSRSHSPLRRPTLRRSFHDRHRAQPHGLAGL